MIYTRKKFLIDAVIVLTIRLGIMKELTRDLPPRPGFVED